MLKRELRPGQNMVFLGFSSPFGSLSFINCEDVVNNYTMTFRGLPRPRLTSVTAVGVSSFLFRGRPRPLGTLIMNEAASTGWQSSKVCHPCDSNFLDWKIFKWCQPGASIGCNGANTWIISASVSFLLPIELNSLARADPFSANSCTVFSLWSN